MAVDMSTLSEVPNSQPSSPALSSTRSLEGERDDESSESKTEGVQLDDSSLKPQACLIPAPPRPPGAQSEQQTASSMPSGRSQSADVEAHQESTVVPNDSPTMRSDTASPSPEAGSRQSTRRRPLGSVSATRDPAYLRSRIAQLTTTARSTQSDLDAALSKLQSLLPPQSIPPPDKPSPLSTSTSKPPAINLDAAQMQTLSQAQHILDDHVKMLSKYNAVKDVGMTMLGILAEQRGVTMRAIMEDRGIDKDD